MGGIFDAVQLRSIELRGFKSFADPVKLPLSARLIGIVGPNGCGKSNIADALRWIMGEQKGRLLRIEKAENLIFNGSQRRKPLPFAEVSLEVEDFSPELPRLTFTRRVYRSGESEYFLNGSPARLKDFLSYFWQVGLTPQSILDGGQVEALIQDRGGARRALIESLAGIERYHHHKKEALAELEKTEQALAQVELLLGQLEGQIEQLKKQAEKVEKYRQLRDAYKEVLLGWIAQEVQSIEKQKAQTCTQIEAQRSQRSGLEENLRQIEERIQQLEKENLTEALSLAEAAYEHLRGRKQELQREESALQERHKHLVRQLEALSEEQAYRLRQKEELIAEEARLRDKRTQVESLLLKEREALADLQARHTLLSQEIQKAEAAYKAKEQERKHAAEKLYKLQSRTNELRAALEPIEERLQSIGSERVHLQAQLMRLEEERRQLLEGQAALAQEVAQWRHQLHALNAYKTALLGQQERLRTTARKVEATLQGLASQRKALEALFAQTEGLPKFLGELRQKREVVFWRTEDIFFAEGNDMVFLATLLRTELPTLWVRSKEEMERLEALLKESKEGFFCVRIYSSSAAERKGWSARFQELEDFAGLATYLWGDVEVGEGMPEKGRRIDPTGRKIYLPDGCLYYLSDSSTAHIGLPHRIQRLQAEERLWEKRKDLLRFYVEHIERELRRLPLERYQRLLREREAAYAQQEKTLSTLQVRREEMEKRLQTLEREAHQYVQQREAKLKEIQQIAPQLQALEAQLTEQEAALTQLQEHLRILQSQYNQASQELSERKFFLAQQESELQSVERAYKLILQQVEQVHRGALAAEERQKETQRDKTKAEQRLAQIAAELSEIGPKIEALKARVEELRGQQKAIESELSRLRVEWASLQKDKEAVQQSIARGEMRLAELEQKYALLRQRAEVEAEVSLTELPAPPSSRLKAEWVEQRLTQLKEEIVALGELNFEAAALLEQLLGRQAELLTQKTDITETLTQLKALIHSLDQEACARFLEAFAAVRERFIALFQGLFAEGDTCDLILVRPEEPLTSEIEIIARPKGKKPLSLQQLSGGEKALTAIALLFATFAVRPSALCVLDEVDAPLDDVNTHKFGQLLVRFSQETPLIVITHNKVTMSYCEQLFGVTMPEPGVSTVLVVDLKVAQEAVAAA
ncbi:MAG: chromosome partition protein Smc [Bacteroidia bacterium]|nr:MAG: chromosome partition protein Smc [Bacteroidia bacterium]